MKPAELIYDWNQEEATVFRPSGRVLLNDETLRDGLQSPSIADPPLEAKVEILHLMEALGINSLDLGLPGAGGCCGWQQGAGTRCANNDASCHTSRSRRHGHGPEHLSSGSASSHDSGGTRCGARRRKSKECVRAVSVTEERRER